MWDQRYGEDGWAYGTDPNDFLVEAAPHVPKGPVLCLAEGEGRNAVFLATCGYDVTAMDQSKIGLDKAQSLARFAKVSFRTEVADLADYDLGVEKWAGVVSIWAHVPPPLRRDLHRRVVASLRPGGAFVLEAYTPAQLQHRTGGPPVAELMMTLSALRDELAGLDLVVARELERDVQEGKYHQGRSAVVQVVGIKPA